LPSRLRPRQAAQPSSYATTLSVTFPKAGVYKLVTKFGEDYMPMPETKGEDNVLRAIVTVA
jgi:hypothetical protein